MIRLRYATVLQYDNVEKRKERKGTEGTGRGRVRVAEKSVGGIGKNNYKPCNNRKVLDITRRGRPKWSSGCSRR